ncbi:MAG: mandelate racemase/muconate lactonizing enzyme family protein [Gemmatimonadota bacterium]|nr:mandelate racemase/muconate lactonizing enzyme family protein [Gemmatimonadota bacterium]
MKITGVDLAAVSVNHRGDWVFVYVNTDEGLRGIGELRAGRNYAGRIRATRELAGWLRGRDPRRIREFLDRFTQFGCSRDTFSAVSALEQALWDILGKSLDVPVYTLLGGPVRDDVRLYANINRASQDRSPENFARLAARAVGEGFDAVKLAPFDEMHGNIDSAAEAAPGIARVDAVRRAVGADVDLLVDCHSRLTVRGALETAAALRDLDVFWFEQPVSESQLDSVVEVNRRCGLQTAGGEGRMEGREFREALENAAMDVIMPDVTVVGGIAKLKSIAELAETFGIPTAPHGPFGPVAVSAGMHVMVSHPGFLVLEYGWGEIAWRRELTLPTEEIVNGRIRPGQRPGLGVELDPDVLNAHAVALN